MPKAGFKSITVNERVYDKFYQVFFDQRDELVMKGVNSFSGYVTFCLEDVMKKDATFAKFAPKLEKITIDTDRVVLQDVIKKRIIEVQFKKNELFCMFCNMNNCNHVGFCESMPDVIEIQGKSEDSN